MKVALVTGGGKRLGRYIALALGRSGFTLVVNYYQSREGALKTVSMLRAIGAEAISVQADITKQREVARMVDKAMGKFGRVDVLVNNSAIFSERSLNRTSDDDWNTTLDINLKSVFLCSKAVAPIMLKQKNGVIINIASLGGIQAWKDHLPYSVSKAGVVMLTKILAKSLAPCIRVNGVAPGTIIMKGEESDSVRHIHSRRIPLKTYGRPEDITDMVVFLATKGKYITGQTIVIDGGRSIM
jgi:3-oxoacyl-[acyl-carrier protein] reductase